MITAEQLREWDVACEGLSLPWSDPGSGDICARTPTGWRMVADFVPYEGDRRFIAVASVAMPALLAEVKCLRALLRDWDAVCKGHCDVEEIAAQVAEVLDV